MAVTLRELATSRQVAVGDGQVTDTTEWVATGSQDEAEILSAAVAMTPAIYRGLLRSRIDLRPQGGGVWFVTVAYGTARGAGGGPSGAGGTPLGVEPPETFTPPSGGDPLDPNLTGLDITVDIQGDMVNIKRSIRTMLSAGPDPPNHNKGINVVDGRAQGVEVLRPKLELTIGVRRRQLNLNRIKTIRSLVGKTNNAPFYGFAIGEVLYAGCSLHWVNTERWSEVHRFWIGENMHFINPDHEDALTIREADPVITIDNKRAWDYLWVMEADEVDAGSIVSGPVAAYVEQVYLSGDFSLLGLG
jgi:hypothetical protein